MFKKWRGSRHHKKNVCDPQSALWAGITLLAFPIVASCANILGWNPVAGFLSGALASFIVLLIEWLTRKTLWIVDPCFGEWLEHPDTMFRLVAFIASLMLVFQTILVSGFLFNTSLDASITRYVLKRQCDVPTDAFFLRICDMLERENRRSSAGIDQIAKAIRDEAKTQYFADSTLVSCAERPVAQERDGQFIYRSSLLQCDRWLIGSALKDAVSVEQVQKFVMTELHINDDGSYQIIAWEDEPGSASWRAVDESFATKALDAYHDLDDVRGVRKRLEVESEYRMDFDLTRD